MLCLIHKRKCTKCLWCSFHCTGKNPVLNRFETLVSFKFTFAFISFGLGDISKKVLLWFTSKSVCLCFPLWVLWSGLTFILIRLIHLSLFLYLMLENILTSFFYMQLSSFPSSTYGKYCLFAAVYSCLLCCRLIDHKCTVFAQQMKPLAKQKDNLLNRRKYMQMIWLMS